MDQYYLGTKESNVIKIFKYITKHAKSTSTYQNLEFINYYNFSQTYLKVLYKELENLRTIYTEFDIIFESNSFMIQLHPNFSIIDIYNIYLKSSLSYKLLESLFFDRFNSLIFFSNSVHYSLRTVQRSSNKLNSFLKNYNISINFKKKVPLTGQEYQIRTFFERFDWELFSEQNFLFIINQSEINKNFLSSLKKYFPQVNDVAYFRILNICRLSVYRIKHGHYILSLPHIFYDITNPMIEYDTFSKNILFPFFLDNHITFDKSLNNEFKFIYGMISILIEYNYENIENTSCNTLVSSKKENVIFNEILSIFECLIGSPLTNKDKRYIKLNFISIYLRFLIFRTTKTIYPINFSLKVTKEKNIDYTIAEKCLKYYTSRYPNEIELFSDKYFIFQISNIVRSILPRYSPKVSICLLSKNSNIYLDIFKNWLSQLNFGNIEFKDINERYDLIISDYSLSNFHDKSSKSVKRIVFTYPLESKNREKIFLVLETIIKEKYEKIWDDYSKKIIK